MTIYNEIEPFAAQWLRELIAQGHIAPGVVDERSIVDLRAADVAGMGQRHFFAGIGGWSHALRLAGVADDANVWTGSCPCQPFSTAGRGGGFSDARHLWPTWFGLIQQCRPAIVFGEQVASPDGLAWLDAVSADLEGAGYAVGAADLCAAGIGAPHIRQRLYFVAYSHDAGSQGWRIGRNGADQRAARARGVAGELADAASPRRSARRDGISGNGGDAARFESERLRNAGIVVNPSGARGRRDTGAVSRAEAAGEGARRGTRGVADEPVDAGAVGGMADDGREGRRQVSEDTRGRREGGREEGMDERSVYGSPVNGFWSPADWIPCRDGKTRPVEPGTFPLANGVPGRVGRLRGYGNAIVPDVAAAFIRAALESIGGFQ